jgi:hypothetical protein
VMVFAPPVPVAIWTMVPWALSAVEGMTCSYQVLFKCKIAIGS